MKPRVSIRSLLWMLLVLVPLCYAASTIVFVGGGGTGVATLAIHGVMVGNGANAVNVTATGTSGQ